MSDVLFSIIVPIYNKEDYLVHCIDSVLEQDFDNFELILVDDGSEDGSLKICTDYAQKDSRIKVVHKENGGLVSARKAGAKKACGEYVLNLDSDDYFCEHALSSLKKIIDDKKYDIIAFNFLRITDSGVGSKGSFAIPSGYYNGESLKSIYKNLLYDSNSVFFTYGLGPNLCTKAIKREIYVKWQNNTIDSITMGEDLSVSMPCLLDAESMYVMGDELYMYRIHSTSMTATFRENEFENLAVLVSYLDKVTNDLGVDISNQISAYIVFRLHEILIGLVRNCDSFKKFKTYISKIPKNLLHHISGFKPGRNGIKSYFVPFVVKNRLWFFYWMMYNKKQL